jgi:putative ABC transport system substrate-binding protein
LTRCARACRRQASPSGVNYAFALCFADGVFDRLPGLALELAALKPRVIVASAAAATAVHKVVPDLPMVFTSYALMSFLLFFEIRLEPVLN